ncbi:MAG: SLBB domain-containing protein [Gemmataceae bacterium]|nr:SLBB domain-containing protein [Gemmataceae bacterium]
MRRMAWLMLALAGCSSSSGGRLALFPEGYRLNKDAREVREATPPPAAIARETDKQVAEPYVVEPGDVLLVQAASLDSPVRLPGDQPVLPDGTIHLGRFGHLQVAGKTVMQVEGEAAALIKGQEKEAGPITARLVTRDSKVFYVVGEVNAPGSFPLRGRECVLDALMAAGGLNSNASKRGMILSRPTAPDSCRVVLPVRFNDIVQLGDTTTNYQIRAGDRIYVPSRDFWEELCHRLSGKKNECGKTHTACPTPGAAVVGHAIGPAPVVPSPVRMDLPKPLEAKP